MKVLIVTYYFPKLTETFILDRITRLIDRGIDVTIMAVSNPAGKSFYEDPKPETIAHSEVEKYNLLQKTVYLNSTSSSVFKEYVQNINPDIIHFQWAFLAEELLEDIDIEVPMLVNYHETKLPSSWKQKKDLLLYKNVIKKCDLLCPTSSYIKEWLLSLGCPKEKLVLHYTGTDVNLFRPLLKRKGHSNTSDTVNIVTNGSFIEKKGHEYTLHALNLLRMNGITNYKLFVIGSGVLEPVYRKLIDSYQLGSNIVFLGRLKKEDVISVYQNSDIFILPSVTGYDNSEEGLPVAMIEAASCALPIVATYHTGTPDIVKTNVTGLLAIERNPFELYKHLKLLIGDVALREKLGAAARDLVISKFNIASLVDETVDMYTKLINKHE